MTKCMAEITKIRSIYLNGAKYSTIECRLFLCFTFLFVVVYIIVVQPGAPVLLNGMSLNFLEKEKGVKTKGYLLSESTNESL